MKWYRRGKLPGQILLVVIAALITSSPTPLPCPAHAAPVSPPFFIDDGDLKNLRTAIAHQLSYLDRLEEDEIIVIGKRSYTPSELIISLTTFNDIINLDISPSERDRLIRDHFTIQQAAGRHGRPGKKMLVTGYYEPILQGSLIKTPPFIHPLYSLPDDLVVERTQSGQHKVGRKDPITGTILHPYWSREEIESSSKLQGHELVYLQNRFEVFLLHIQGSGKIQLVDGEIRSVRYRGNNGHSYTSIGKVLVDKGILSLEEVNVPAIREHLAGLPDSEVSEILYHNRRYIFFDWGKGEFPRGSTGLPLTPERSIAIDGNVLPMPTVAYLVTRRPVFDEEGNLSHWQPLRRFVLPQDTGSAIVGTGRVDFFYGASSYAEKAAGLMKEDGELYFLIKKFPK